MSRAPPPPAAVPSVADILRGHVRLELPAIDRMYLNVYVPQLQLECGVLRFFHAHRKQPWASSALMQPISRRFVAALERFVTVNKLPMVLFRKQQRKDDEMRERLRAFRAQEGVVFVGKAQEKTAVFCAEKRRNQATGYSYPWIVKSSAMVNHYYVYAVDRDFGPFFLKFCTYFPYNARLCLNGHEYAKRQLDKRAIPCQVLDNGVLSCADPARLQAICDGLSAAKIDALLRKWLRLLPHPFTPADRRAGYRYDLSILQAEFSLTQVLDRPVHGRMFFEQVICENLDLGRPDEVQLLFDRRITRRTPGRFRTRVVTQGVTPSLNIYYKHTRIKQFHKEQQALRTETTINNSYDFGIGRRLDNLPKLQAIGFAINRRLLRVERVSHDCMLAEQVFQNLNRPLAVAGQHVSAFRFGDPQVQRLCHALVLFRLLANGFRQLDLRQHLAALSGHTPDTTSRGTATYQLRRLRLHGLIERLPRSHRYRVTDFGFRAALFFSRTYLRVLRPGLACILPTTSPVAIPLKRSFDNLGRDLQTWIHAARLTS